MKIIIQKEYDVEYFDFLRKEMNKVPKVDSSTRIIFLDVDGVLNSTEWIDENPNTPAGRIIDPAAVARVNSLVEKTGAKIVISSSWRTKFIGMPNGFKFLVEFFNQFGISNIVGMTPELRGKRRCDEIIAWLNTNPIESFVILDDDLSANVRNRQVKTMFSTGLQDYHIDEAVAILETKL